MKMIITSDCEYCRHGTVDESSGKLMVHCYKRDKTYYFGQCIPCEDYIKSEINNKE